MKKNLLKLLDLSEEDILSILNLGDQMKFSLKNGLKHDYLSGMTLAMIFQKASTRTRVSFETGMYQLGGYPLILNSNDLQLGRGEPIQDTAKVLSRYIDAIMIRTFKQSDVEGLANHGSIPVINGLTDEMHPCQILADLMTVQENKGSLKGLKMTYVGDGNNIAHSLLHGCAKTGMHIAIATPKSYCCTQKYIDEAVNTARSSGSVITITDDPVEAVTDADVIYTDTWISMGMESEKVARIEEFKDYQVNTSLVSHAKPDAIFLHCLPAYRGLEVTEEVIDGPMSRIFDEAENRLHAQKAILVKLLS